MQPRVRLVIGLILAFPALLQQRVGAERAAAGGDAIHSRDPGRIAADGR